MRLQLNEKKSKGSQTRLMGWYCNRNRLEGRTWLHIIVTLWLCFLLFDWLSFGEGVLVWNWTSKIKGCKNFGLRWTRGLRGLENWKISVDIVCVSSLSVSADFTKKLHTDHFEGTQHKSRIVSLSVLWLPSLPQYRLAMISN